MKRRSQRGITLVELTIAVTIILILGAISIPNLLRARQSAYEASAAGFMHTVQTEQIAYRASHGSYASSFRQLPGIAALTSAATDATTSGISGPGSSVTIIDSGAGGGAGATSTLIRQSYIFTMRKATEEQWNISGTPILDRVQGQYYYTDESGSVHSAKGAPPSSDSGFAQ
jgi:type II secretory pathway pseudopilin PulG